MLKTILRLTIAMAFIGQGVIINTSNAYGQITYPDEQTACLAGCPEGIKECAEMPEPKKPYCTIYKDQQSCEAHCAQGY